MNDTTARKARKNFSQSARGIAPASKPKDVVRRRRSVLVRRRSPELVHDQVHELVRELVHDQVHELVRELVHDQVRDLVRDEDASLARLLEQEQARMAHLDELDDKARESPHVRAVKLRARMRQYSSIYNAAWHVRAAQHGAPEQRARKIADFVRVLRAELERTKDQEAFIYAVADALTAYPRGLPWES